MPRSTRSIPFFTLLVSAFCAALAARMAWQEPRLIYVFVVISILGLVPPWLARRRTRRILMSGDVKRVLGSWSGSIHRVRYPETMAPLLAATAYASYGWVEAARDALERAVRGPAWEAALEQRLFIETLLDTFEGDRDAAVRKAAALEAMPMPPAGRLALRKVARLRSGVGAFARAFAHAATPRDLRTLRRAARTSPLVHWAMRYAAAVVAIDTGRRGEVPALLAGAPEWPAESAFRVFHDELLARADASS